MNGPATRAIAPGVGAALAAYLNRGGAVFSSITGTWAVQNYYHVLGVGATVTAVQIEEAYACQRARFKRLAVVDRVMKTRLAEVVVNMASVGALLSTLMLIVILWF